MATTLGTTYPIAPVSRKGHQGSTLCVEPLDPGISAGAGDILVIDGTTADMNVDNTPDGTKIFGVAVLSPKAEVTAAATIDRDRSPGPDESDTWHSVNVALALPSQVFAGNIINESAADETGVYADNIHQNFDIAESTDGYACLEIDGTPGGICAFSLRYASPQYDNQASTPAFSLGREAGVGVINPRVEFMFLVDATVFGPII